MSSSRFKPLLIFMTLVNSTAIAAADPVEDFYRAKSINLIIGFPAGGDLDAYGRLIARHIGDHIPGHPTILPQNMAGAGGLKAANYIFNSAPKDGTEFGIVSSATLMQPLFGNQQALFKASNFSWLGSASQDVYYCGVNPASHITSFDQLLNSDKDITFGAGGTDAPSYQHPMVLKNVLGAKLQVIPGYDGLSGITLAVRRGEVDGMCDLTVSGIKALYQPMIDSGQLKLIVQMGTHKDNTFGDVPSVFDYAKSDDQRQILSLVFDQLALGRPFFAPPNIPSNRFGALNKAFAETLKDSALLADSNKMKLDISYLSGEGAMKLLTKFADEPADLVEKAKLAMGQR